MYKSKEVLVNILVIAVLSSILLYLLPVEAIRFLSLIVFVFSGLYLFRIYVGNKLYSKINHLIRVNKNEDAIVLSIKYDNFLNLRKIRLLCKLAIVEAYYNMGDYQKAFDNLEKIELSNYDSKYVTSMFCFRSAELFFVLGKEEEGLDFYEEYEKDILALRKYLNSRKEKQEFDNIVLFISTYIKILNKNKEVVNSILKELKDTWSISDVDKRNYKILFTRVKKLK